MEIKWIYGVKDVDGTMGDGITSFWKFAEM